MKVVTAEQMRGMDRRVIEEFGVPGPVLMENAGRAVVDVIVREYSPVDGRRVNVYCGTGNNGGDGFVIARLLSLLGAKVTVMLAGSAEKIQGDALVHYRIFQKLQMPVQEISEEDAERLRENVPSGPGISGTPLIVDALLGTGLRSAPRSPYTELIARINATGWPVIAVDIPSGVDADTGAAAGEAVRADHTVTFAFPKWGHFLFPGAEGVGKLHVSDIGFQWSRVEGDIPSRWLRPSNYPTRSALLQKRAPNSNKGDYGHVGVLAGSRGMAGAPALTARAAQRSGAGLVTVLAPACVQPAIGAKLDEQMTIPLPDLDGALAEDAFDAIAKFATKATVLCIGPGLTTAPQTVQLVQRIVKEIAKPLILDADGLNALAKDPAIIRQRPNNPLAPLVLTPHPGEAARLLGISIAEVEADRVEAVRELAKRFGAVALLKGRYTLISDPAGSVSINTTGNPGMATGGSGDTLTGILGGLLARLFSGPSHPSPDIYAAYSVYETVCLGVMLHGIAGDLAAQKVGETALVAGDLLLCLPEALQMLEEKN